MRKFLYLFFVIALLLCGCTQKADSTKEDELKTESPVVTKQEEVIGTPDQTEINNNESIEYNGNSYKIIEVDGGKLSGERMPNIAVDVGYGDRVYWALTNEYGQLKYVIADKVIIQDDKNEAVNSDGRYYDDEAKVSGTEQEDLDEGHVIADSLGGVSNAYNITPQNSILNRHGNQAYMEKVIRDAGGCKNFVTTITYSNIETQIPSKYRYEYILNGYEVVDEFENVNPDEANGDIGLHTDEGDGSMDDEFENVNPDEVNREIGGSIDSNDAPANEKEVISKIDTNGNGTVTIAEAKKAGFSMPIHSDNWLYKYMYDGDGDGIVGE